MVRHRHFTDTPWPPLYEFQHDRATGDLEAARQLILTLRETGILARTGGVWAVSEDCPPSQWQEALELCDLLNYIPAAGLVAAVT